MFITENSETAVDEVASRGSILVKIIMTAIAYLAGPDVFLPNAQAHAAKKIEVCRSEPSPRAH
jgi:hypothetical protein